MFALKPKKFGKMPLTKPSKKRAPRPIDADVMDEVGRLVNIFKSDFEPHSVSLEQLRMHSIEIGRVRIDYKKKRKKFYFKTKFAVHKMTPLLSHSISQPNL